MSKYFFTNQNIYKESNLKLPQCDAHVHLDPDESRTFHQGKSFRFWNWEDNKDRTYINDEFYQDFVSCNGTVYVCVNTTTDHPENSKDWKIAQTPIGTRARVNDTEDLTSESNWEHFPLEPYNGMIVSVINSGDIYVLLDKDNLCDIQSWKKVTDSSDLASYVTRNEFEESVEFNTATIVATAEAIRSEVASVKEDLEGNISENKTFIEQTAKDIELKAVEIQEIEGRVAEAEASITLNAGKIELAAQEAVELENAILQNSSVITQTAENINQKVTSLEEDFNGKITEVNAQINITADSITQRVDQKITDVNGRIEEANTKINQTANDIELTAEKLVELDGVTKENAANIKLESDRITSTVSELTIVEDRVSTAESNIIQTSDRITQEVSNLTNYTDDQIVNTRSYIDQTAETIRLGVTEQVERLDGSIENAQSEFNIKAGEISTSVQNVKTNLEGQITETNAQIVTTAEAIRSEVESVQTSLDGKITSANTNITQTAEKIEQQATKIEMLENVTKEHDSKFEQTAESITQAVSNAKSYADGHLETARGELKTTADNITASVESVQQNLQGQINTASTQITANTNAINLKASQSSLDILQGQVNNQAATLDIHADEIAQRVESSTFNSKTGEIDNRITTVSTNLDGVTTRVSNTEGKIATITQDVSGLNVSVGNINATITSLQNQVDGAIETWYYSGAPSYSKLPESNWTTDSVKKTHTGDLYYDTTTGYAYRYTPVTNGYEWKRIKDTDITAALNAAQNNSKTFIDEPTPPYKKGDLWILHKDYSDVGKQNDIFACVVSKTSGNFDINDWEKKNASISESVTDDFHAYVENAVKDGLDESEKRTIQESWNSIVLYQQQLTSGYQTLILTNSTLSEYISLKTAYSNVYSTGSTKGKYQLLESAVNAIVNYVIPDTNSNLESLITTYRTAYNDYKTAIGNYSSAEAAFTNAIRAQLGKANTYIESIVDDGQITPIEKKQLLDVYKKIAAEFESNKNAALNYKIWKSSNGSEVAGAYPGPNKTGTSYFNTYVAYKNAYTPILNVFTGTDWGFDKPDETTVLSGNLNLTTLDTYFDTYYSALKNISNVITTIAKELQEANDAVKQYADNLGEHFTPTESITQVGAGVVMSSIIGVGKYNTSTKKYDVTAALNATNKNESDLKTSDSIHGRVVFAGGLDKITNGNWNEATTAIYEDGHIVANSAHIKGTIQLGSGSTGLSNMTEWNEYKSLVSKTTSDLDTAITNAQKAAKDYTDEGKAALQKAINNLDAAKAGINDVYTISQMDGIISEAEQNAMTAAQEYADAAQLEAEKTSKAYADNKLSDAETRILSTAQGYSEAARIAAETNARSVADGLINSAEQRANQAAENYAAEAKRLAEETAKAYADDEIDASEAKVIAEAEAKVAAAKEELNRAIEAVEANSSDGSNAENLLVDSNELTLTDSANNGSLFKLFMLPFTVSSGDIFTFKAESSTAVSGSFTKYTVAICNLSNLGDIQTNKVAIGTNRTVSITIPSGHSNTKCAFKIYAGLKSATQGNTIRVNNFSLVKSSKPMVMWKDYQGDACLENCITSIISSENGEWVSMDPKSWEGSLNKWNFGYAPIIHKVNSGEVYTVSIENMYEEGGVSGNTLGITIVADDHQTALTTTTSWFNITTTIKRTWVSFVIKSGVSNASAELLFKKGGGERLNTAHFENVSLVRGQRPLIKWKENTQYVVDAFKDGSTEINGGLVMSQSIMVKDENGTVQGMLNGSDYAKDSTTGTKLIFAAGSNGAQEHNMQNAKSRIYADGKLVAKDVELEGKITATSGKIGNFNIIDGEYMRLDNPKTSGYMSLSEDGITFFSSLGGSPYARLGNGCGDSVVLQVVAKPNIGAYCLGEAVGQNVGIHVCSDKAAILCDEGMFYGLRPRIRTITSSTEDLTSSDHTIIVNRTGSTVINLPTGDLFGERLVDGQHYEIYCPYTGQVTINGEMLRLVDGVTSDNDTFSSAKRRHITLIYSASFGKWLETYEQWG